MSFRKIKPRGNAKRYKRFSSAAISAKSGGPTTAAVFPGGRLIPDSSKSLFDYRHRGTTLALTEQEIIDKIHANGKLLEFFGLKPAGQSQQDAFWAQLRLDMEKRGAIESHGDPRLAVLDRLEQLKVQWQGEIRGLKVHTWNYVKLPIAERKPATGDWLRMYFSGLQFIFVERDEDIYRRSLVYPAREKAMRDYGYKNIIWVHRDAEFLSSPPASVSPMRC